MPRFRVKAGKHHELNGQIFKAGQIFFSNKDYCKAFPNKFEKIEEAPPADAPNAPTPPPNVDSFKAEPPKSVADEPGPGLDVTSTFPQAGELDLLVFKLKPGQYNVCDKDEPGKPMNEKPLSKAKTIEFLAAQAKPAVVDEDDETGLDLVTKE